MNGVQHTHLRGVCTQWGGVVEMNGVQHTHLRGVCIGCAHSVGWGGGIGGVQFEIKPRLEATPRARIIKPSACSSQRTPPLSFGTSK